MRSLEYYINDVKIQPLRWRLWLFHIPGMLLKTVYLYKYILWLNYYY